MITVIGSIGFDLTTISDRLPEPGETLVGTGFVSGPGGKGANQALAAKRAGAVTRCCKMAASIFPMSKLLMHLPASR
jgi:ribokinase